MSSYAHCNYSHPRRYCISSISSAGRCISSGSCTARCISSGTACGKHATDQQSSKRHRWRRSLCEHFDLWRSGENGSHRAGLDRGSRGYGPAHAAVLCMAGTACALPAIVCSQTLAIWMSRCASSSYDPRGYPPGLLEEQRCTSSASSASSASSGILSGSSDWTFGEAEVTSA